MAASRLIHYVSKTHRNAYGVFAEASDDLGDLKIPNVPPMIQMAYAYARRAAAAGLYYQNIFTHDQYMQIYTVFLAYQHSTGQSVDFQEEAYDQAIEFLQSYDNRITKQVVGLMVTGVQTAGSNNVPPGAPINSVEKVFSMIENANETRIYFDNKSFDIQTAMKRCFQFIEEKRYEKAQVIIDQILNIEPDHTDANIANFLCQFQLTCINDIVTKRYFSYKIFKDSSFYKRVKKGKKTCFSKDLDETLKKAEEKASNNSCGSEIGADIILSLIFGLVCCGIYLVLTKYFTKTAAYNTTVVIVILYIVFLVYAWIQFIHDHIKYR